MTTETTGRTAEQEERIRKAKARLAAAELRIRACQQDDQAAGYFRQMQSPAYPDQAMVCAGKAAGAQAFAARTRAQADLIEAEAGL